MTPTLTERTVTAADWRSEHQQLADAGLVFFDFLAATDSGAGGTELVTHVLTPRADRRVLTRCRLEPGELIASLTAVYPAADWHEREAFDLLGVEFAGHPDLRSLIATADSPPLRRETPLAPRIDSPWPGLYEPGAEPGTTRRRRPKAVPGNNEEWAGGGAQ